MDLSKAPKFGDDYPQTTANNTNNSPSNGANNINRANNSASGDGISASNSANFENLADNRNFHDNASFAPFSASEEGSFVNDGGMRTSKQLLTATTMETTMSTKCLSTQCRPTGKPEMQR